MKLKGSTGKRTMKDKMCRICQKEEESFKHILSKRETTQGGQDLSTRKFLDETGGGIKLMKRIKKEREEMNCIEEEKQGNSGREDNTAKDKCNKPKTYIRVYKL